MAAIVGIISRHGLNIDGYHRNQPKKSKPALCKDFENYVTWTVNGVVYSHEFCNLITFSLIVQSMYHVTALLESTK